VGSSYPTHVLVQKMGSKKVRSIHQKARPKGVCVESDHLAHRWNERCGIKEGKAETLEADNSGTERDGLLEGWTETLRAPNMEDC
jgi:hypothetical protein